VNLQNLWPLSSLTKRNTTRSHVSTCLVPKLRMGAMWVLVYRQRGPHVSSFKQAWISLTPSIHLPTHYPLGLAREATWSMTRNQDMFAYAKEKAGRGRALPPLSSRNKALLYGRGQSIALHIYEYQQPVWSNSHLSHHRHLIEAHSITFTCCITTFVSTTQLCLAKRRISTRLRILAPYEQSFYLHWLY